MIKFKRIYDRPEASDGTRVLADRLWPRGLTRDKAAIDEWAKDIAPSNDLRRWYGHIPERWEEFRQRYRREPADPGRSDALDRLRRVARSDVLTLLTATRATSGSHLDVLREVLQGEPQ